jgi:hypothetical protein
MIAQDLPGAASGSTSPVPSIDTDVPVLRRAVEPVRPPIWHGWTRIAALAAIGLATEPAAYLRLADEGHVAAVSWALVFGLGSMIGACLAARTAIRRNTARRVRLDPFRAASSAAPIATAVVEHPV